MRPQREWITPLTLASFVVMAITGLLMFFHLQTPLQGTVHEWAGWLLVLLVLLHGWVHWLPLQRYFQSGRRRAGGLLTLAVALTVLTGVLRPSGPGAEPPPALAIRAIAQAPLTTAAPLFGKSPAQARQDLAAAGIVLDDERQSLASVVGDDRGRLGAALGALARH